ncbi:hypothetical protein [Brevibacillus daliensis]|uniref:hypothetical protein n=1 Tax=Brevibacillus daliensis TaxID=2892995 RepID=UPI001E49AABC|nr:hypothetical protein [Brevibacillus daliensis]
MLNKEQHKLTVVMWVSILCYAVLRLLVSTGAPFIQSTFQKLNIPVSYLTYIPDYLMDGIFLTFFLFMIMLVLIRRDGMKQPHIRVSFITPIVISVTLLILQTCMATGVYALDYISGRSHCNYKSTVDGMINGSCQLYIKNNGNKVIQFAVDVPTLQGMEQEKVNDEPIRAEYIIQPHSEEIFELPFQVGHPVEGKKKGIKQSEGSGKIQVPHILIEADGEERSF